DLALALELADAADVLTLDRFQSLDLVVETKPDLTPVSDADTATERVLRERLAASRPEDGVHGEEYGGEADVHGRTWVLDPIDGTKNFVRGVPVWATLVALLEDGVPVVGVVSAPALGRRWWAATGSGAWGSSLSGAARRLRVSEVSRLEDASVSYSDPEGWGERQPGFESLLATAWRSRAYGDFWSHVLVAEGAVDVAAEPQLALWDVAALIPVVVEAGGRVTGCDGRRATGAAGALTTNGFLHEAALAALVAR
ncbi:MAG TPA: histidinol-phosphatase, partial [Candidatus Limnocylindria bacterium]|nr:histidinol-phosphatase [Candidatus Limnocylindria bacterium]